MTASEMPAPLVASVSPWSPTARVGLLGAAVTLYACLVGIVGVFAARPLVTGLISLGQASLVMIWFGTGYLAAQRSSLDRRRVLAAGALAGAIAGASAGLLVLIGSAINLRVVLLQASPALFNLLTFGLGPAGAWIPLLAGAVLGAAAALLSVQEQVLRRALTWGLAWLVIGGLFAGLLRVPMVASPVTEALADVIFGSEGLTLFGAIVLFAVVVAYPWLNRRARWRQRIAALPAERRRALRLPTLIVGLLFVLWLPQGLGSFFAQVAALVALYVLMGFGLNITLGLAGLLDLGFVAFFAVGAYTVALLTSTAEFGLAQWPFWAAVPVAVILAMAFGIFFGLPILGIRGDYLAIATLGFGEIVRILAGSDLLKPWLGGPQGILNVPKPVEVGPDSFLAGPLQIYYISIALAAVAAFIAVRLRGSRLGRAWVAIREDEDVAEALGINLIQTKLLAYMLGAAFAGLGGAIFAGLVGSIFASSMQLFVSINVVSLIIVGGMGSIPGVVVGAVFLIGVPELFREFSEYRFLFYGMALIAMMQYRPEGLLPSRIVRRELHGPGAVENGPATEAAPATETGLPSQA